MLCLGLLTQWGKPLAFRDSALRMADGLSIYVHASCCYDSVFFYVTIKGYFCPYVQNNLENKIWVLYYPNQPEVLL